MEVELDTVKKVMQVLTFKWVKRVDLRTKGFILYYVFSIGIKWIPTPKYIDVGALDLVSLAFIKVSWLRKEWWDYAQDPMVVSVREGSLRADGGGKKENGLEEWGLKDFALSF